jgi:acetolactate synthase-1/2/3 large subunit
VLREAFDIASSGRKGPVLIDITKDAQAASCEWEDIKWDDVRAGGASAVAATAVTTVAAAPQPDDIPAAAVTAATLHADDADVILEALAASQRPLVLFGGGIVSADASEELQSFLHALRLPAAHSIMGTGVLAFDDELNVGLVGMHGKLSGNRALAEADLILALGFRFSDRVALDREHWGSAARIIHVDIDPSEHDKNIEVADAVVGDVRTVLRALSDRLATNSPSAQDTASWLDRIASWRAEDYQPSDSEVVLRPHQVIGAIAELAGPDAIITTDVGQHQMWAAQYSRRTRPRSFLTSGGLGAMGFGYGAAIGAQIGAGGGSARTRPVIHITGDGSFHMNLNEACTAVSYRLPIISVILNNQVLGMVRQLQKAFYDARYSATTLERATDYVKVAEGFGVLGMRATTIEEFRTALMRALAADGPVWIECVIDREEQVLPLIPVGGNVDDAIVE